MEKTTFKERVKLVCEWYEREYGGTVKGFERKCGLGNAYVQGLLKREESPKKPAYTKIADALPEINRDWLAYGYGEMLVKDMPHEVATAEEGSPYYDVDFRGGFDFVENIGVLPPDGYINMPPFNGESFLWCNITGESMAPLIRSGSRICLKILSGGVEDVVFGEVYALVIKGSDGSELHRTVKWVVRCPDDERKVRLVPENKEPQYGTYQDFYKDSIIFVYKVMFSGTVF